MFASVRLLPLLAASLLLSACTAAGNTEFAQSTRSPASLPSPIPTASPAPLSVSARASCPVTGPNGKSPGPASASDFNLGNEDGTIFTIPWPDGTVVFEPGGPGAVLTDGSMAMKWPWYRTIPGLVTIEGWRLDAPAPPMPEINLRGPPDGYGDVGFHPSALIFPTEGCWQVTAMVSHHSLTFVTLVVKIGELPIPTERPPDLYIRPELTRYDLYPIPSSCSIDPLSQREMRRGFTAWWWLGDGLDAGSNVGLLFEGDNKIQWQSYYEGDFAASGELIGAEEVRLQLVSARRLDLPEFLGQVLSTSVLFPSPGCFHLRGNVGDQTLDATVYVYPSACRPSHLRDTDEESPKGGPCQLPPP